MLNIAVLVSGGGTNLQAIIDSIKGGFLKNVSIKFVISDREGAYGIERAAKEGIKTLIFDRKVYRKELSAKILEHIKNQVDFIVLAGYLSLVDEPLISEFNHRIINIHPSLIPSFCGKGMYGLKVHQAAINYGVKFSGCTVHFVDENTDTGAIILQRVVKVQDNDTPEELQRKILKEEHQVLPLAIKLISEGKVVLKNRKVIIEE